METPIGVTSVDARVHIADDGARLEVVWPGGRSCLLSPRWLFDHADGARDPASGQRPGGAIATEGAVRISAAVVEAGVVRLRLEPSGVERRVALRHLRPDPPAPAAARWETAAPIATTPPIAFAAYLQDDGALCEALRRVAGHGIALLDGVGVDPQAVERAVARFGFIRETNYGRLFDVRIEPQPGNLAYTERALDLHTDNPYREPVPTLQLLHAIIADAGGGETVFVDGFAQAEALRRETPAAFGTLARTPVRFTFRDASGARWSAARPVLELGPTGDVVAVNLNHRSLDLAPGGDPAATDAWYDAYVAFYRRAHDPAAAYARRLAPGELVIFDNRRLLHGRRAMAGRSRRWLRGCYADRDGLAATLARLEAGAGGGG